MSERTPPLVALLESRMSPELARLVEKHGGAPLSVPALRESPAFSVEHAHSVIDELASGRHEFVVFMTGVAVSLLFEMAEQAGRRPELVRSLRILNTVCRGPKPTAALRGFGVPPTLSAREPFTSAEVIDAMSNVELRGRHVLLLHYGERSETLAETLLAQRAELAELWLYRWLMPLDVAPLEELVISLARSEVDALVVTCQAQFRHLYEVAVRIGLEKQLVKALNRDVTVAAVGPTCAAILEAHRVSVDVIPDHPKMGPLVLALMRHLEHSRASAKRASNSSLVAFAKKTTPELARGGLQTGTYLATELPRTRKSSPV
ncbi:MAG TPA: uroporphyrinogen-III synthase [Polyangiaceae bacterium]|nr:uroporphyrinogen-III synthase [Polyangiaceae bacterium]